MIKVTLYLIIKYTLIFIKSVTLRWMQMKQSIMNIELCCWNFSGISFNLQNHFNSKYYHFFYFIFYVIALKHYIQVVLDRST